MRNVKNAISQVPRELRYRVLAACYIASSPQKLRYRVFKSKKDVPNMQSMKANRVIRFNKKIIRFKSKVIRFKAKVIRLNFA